MKIKRVTTTITNIAFVLMLALTINCQSQDVSSSSSSGSISNEKGSISGKATLENATDHSDITISIKDEDLSAQTDSNGNYLISDVPVGSYTISIEKDAYISQEIDAVEVQSDMTAIVETTELTEQ